MAYPGNQTLVESTKPSSFERLFDRHSKVVVPVRSHVSLEDYTKE